MTLSIFRQDFHICLVASFQRHLVLFTKGPGIYTAYYIYLLNVKRIMY